MADKYQEAILNAISYIVDNRMASIDRDKTITATVVGVNNASTQEYKVSYNGGTIAAYAQENASYAKDASVYVLVPEGDFSKRKTIVGLATDSSSDKNTSFVSSALNDYNKIGANCVTQPDNLVRWGLNSYKKEDYKLIYQHGISDPDFVKVDNAAFQLYLKEAEAILLQGTFQTALPKEHRYSSSGTYGVSFVLAFKNGDEQVKQYSVAHVADVAVTDCDYEIDESSFAVDLSNSKHRSFVISFLSGKRELAANWSLLQSKDMSQTDFTKWYQTHIKNLESGAKELGLSVACYTEAINAKDTKGNIVIPQFDYEITTASAKSAATILASSIKWIKNNTSSFAANKTAIVDYLKKLRFTDDTEVLYADTTYQDNEALSSLLDEFLSLLDSSADIAADIEDTEIPAVKHISYTLDTTNMLGSPLNYFTPLSQYGVFNINPDNFLYVESILLFSKDFVAKDDYGTNYHDSNNIFFQDFQLFALQPITSVNGDYVLRIDMPQGGLFKNTLATNTLEVDGSFTRLQDDLSDSASFFWFQKDDRVSSTSEEYRALAGAGWRYIQDLGTVKTITLKASDNKAYENQYLCVVQYQSTMVLKANFIIYNDSCQRDITIESNFPNNVFSFDRGNPVLTCKVNGKGANFETGQDSPHADNLFSFSWTVTDAEGNVKALDKTAEELTKEIEQAQKDNVGYSKILSLKNDLAALNGVVIDDNILTYPVNKISERATFSCSVFLRENLSSESYYIGVAQLTLRNASSSTSDYSINITNGDQVFQYSESGVSPASERNTDPQEILPLECHLFDPSGLEVNSNTYSVKWKVPLDDTLITTPTVGMETNPANSLKEWYTAAIYPLGILESYDYQATHNQVTCIITYQGQEYTQDSALTFMKIGDNGTNGTDVVAKISAPAAKDGGLFALTLTDNGSATSVSTNAGDNAQLSFNLYRQSVALNPTAVSWSVAPVSNRAKNLTLTSSGAKCGLGWGTSSSATKKYENLIVKGVTTLRNSAASTNTESAEDVNASSTAQTYNAFYPLPIIHYGQKNHIYVKIDRDETLKQVLYNADGRNPMYNKKQGVSLGLYTDEKCTNPISTQYKVKWEVRGGVNEKADTASLRLSETENSAFSTAKTSVEQTNAAYIEVEVPVKDSAGNVVKNDDGTIKTITETQFSAYSPALRIYAVPADVYSGEYMNHVIQATISSVTNNVATQVCTVIVPIYLSLNSYGLASLNAWDGNHIEINEDGNYILAPQIGAGYKGKDPNDSTRDNVFTGVVIGQATTYDDMDKTNTTGILGYSGGKQSVHIDAASGKAVFGLPSDAASQENAYNEGRIKLIPGGNSQVGNWNIGSCAIYSAKQLRGGKWYGIEQDGDNDTTIAKSLDVTKEPLKSEYKGRGGGYAVQDASIAIPHDMQGVILSSFPAYLSIKGKPLNKDNSSISWNDANTVLKEEDSLEVEIDPNNSSLFSIYRHTCWNGGTKGDAYYRYPLVGINANGQFYTNAVENGESSMGIGRIGAFGKSAADELYVGGQFAYGSKNIFKFFTDEKSSDLETSPLYITTGTTLSNEYARPVKLYGKNFALYTSNSSSTATSSGHYFTINDDDIVLGHGTGTAANYLSLTSNVTHTNTLQLPSSNVSVSLGKALTSSISGKVTSTVTGGVKNTVSVSGNTSGLAVEDIVMGYTKRTVSKYSAATYGSGNMQIDVSLGDNSSSPVLLKKTNTGNSTVSRLEFKSTGAVDMVSQGQGMTVLSNNSGASYPLTLASKGPGAIVQIGAFQEANTTTKETLSWANNVAAYLRLKSRTDGQTWFSLNSNRGTVYSNPSTGSGDTGLSINIPYITNNIPASAANVNPNMVVVDPMLYVPGAAVFAGKYSGQTSSFYDCSVFAQQGVLSKRYMLWDNTSSWKSWSSSSNYGSELQGIDANNIEKILVHLQTICDKLAEKCNSLQDQHNSLKSKYNAHTHDMTHTHSFTLGAVTATSTLSGISKNEAISSLTLGDRSRAYLYRSGDEIHAEDYDGRLVTAISKSSVYLTSYDTPTVQTSIYTNGGSISTEEGNTGTTTNPE